MMWIYIVFKRKPSLGLIRIYVKMREIEGVNCWLEQSIIFIFEGAYSNALFLLFTFHQDVFLIDRWVFDKEIPVLGRMI